MLRLKVDEKHLQRELKKRVDKKVAAIKSNMLPMLQGVMELIRKAYIREVFAQQSDETKKHREAMRKWYFYGKVRKPRKHHQINPIVKPLGNGRFQLDVAGSETVNKWLRRDAVQRVYYRQLSAEQMRIAMYIMEGMRTRGIYPEGGQRAWPTDGIMRIRRRAKLAVYRAISQYEGRSQFSVFYENGRFTADPGLQAIELRRAWAKRLRLAVAKLVRTIR